MQKNCISSALNRVFNPIIISAEYYYKMAIQKEQCNGIKLSHVCHSEVFYQAVSHGWCHRCHD